MTVPVSIQQARLSERLHIAEQLIESVESSELQPKEKAMSLTIEREVERKPMFGAIKRAVLGGSPTIPPKPSRAVEHAPETPHQKVFRLIGERRIEEASRLAARLINSGEAGGFFIYSGTQAFRRYEAWFLERVAAGKRGQYSSIETITPEVAQILLKNNEGNRRVNAAALAGIIRDILDGSWDLNGETFKVSREGFLNDSQHRNFGVLLSGKSIKTHIVFGVAREMMRTTDTGRKRTAADRLAIKGEGDYVAYSAISGLSFEIANGRAGTAREVDEYFEANADDIRLAHKLAGANIRGLGPSIAGAASLHLLRVRAKQADIRNFFKVVRTGDALRGDAARVVYDAINPKQGVPPVKMKKTAWVSVLCAHFLAWTEGRRVRGLIVDEPLPEAR